MKLWSPSKNVLDSTNSTRFLKAIESRWGVTACDFHTLYEWSIRYPEKFWESVWGFCDVQASTPWKHVLERGAELYQSKWFSGAKLNFAENLLRYQDNTPALIFSGEDRVKRSLTYKELYQEVGRLSAAMKASELRQGDRVAAVVANIPEAVAAMLATTSLGAIWSSCSPDFGLIGIVDRFAQIEPKILFIVDGYIHKGKEISITDKIPELLKRIPSLGKIVIVPYLGKGKMSSSSSASDGKVISLAQYTANCSQSEISFASLDFSDPVYILFSSGTTGKPKCIVHSVGGILVEHLKELILHTDLRRSDRIFYQTTCGWMMWNWLVSSLAVGATVILYDGAPLHNDGRILWELAEQEGVTIFGTNAKYLLEIEKRGIKPGAEFNLEKLRAVLSTGSPLLPQSFDYVYRDIKKDLCLSSISGGTDIVGCFALGSPTLPVFKGELQTRSLGLKVEVLSQDGRAVRGEKGELVCSAPFPSMPIGFWGDKDNTRYRAAYFERFPGVWHHGDLVELTENNGMIFYGRSDTVLNPGGVRIGTAEIYRVVEQCPEISDSLAVGQHWDGDIRVILFVKLAGDCELGDELISRIKTACKEQASPFHVPKMIIAAPDLPRTRSGKLAELAVRDLLDGREPSNLEALSNPESLEFFRNCEQLKV